MKTIMLNQKSAIKFEEIETYVTNTKVYQNKFIIFPSSLYINYFVENGYNVGIQNIAENNRDNQTGEITALQASCASVRYTIIGHSERRINQKEDSKVLLNKVKEAINNNLNIVFCVGESLVDYKLENTEKFILSELSEVFEDLEIPSNIKLYVAYEPIWAIGSGLTPTSFEIQKVANCIRKYLESKNFKDFEILYGGSVNDKNIDSLNEIKEIDGFLIGGASCNYEKTIKICESVMNSTN